ncbi:MAG: hypothetical protein AAF587_43945 [Bacteroidota bacterium]
MAKKRTFKISTGLVFGWLGLLVAVGFFWLRADETGDQLVELFLRNQAHVEGSVKSVDKQSQLLKIAMREQIAADTNKQHAGLLDTLQLVGQEVEAVLARLNVHLHQLDSIGGRIPGTLEYQRPAEAGANIAYWDTHRPNLESLLGDFGNYVTTLTKSESQEEIADFSHWQQLPLEGPVAANIALIQGIKLEVLQAERQLLDLYNQRLGVSDYQANRLIPWAMPKSESALVGMPYEIRLGFMATTDAVPPTFSSPSGNITLDEASVSTAILTVVPNSSAIPFGQKEGSQTYSATIKIPKLGGGHEYLDIENEFPVRTPVATIQPRKGYFLYRYCANDIRIEIPELQEVNNLSISATQAQVTPSQNDPGLFRIYPVGNQAELRVSSFYNGRKSLISSIPVQVVTPPKPRIELLVNGEAYEGEVPVSRGSIVEVRVIPNIEFQQMYEEDANYGINSIEVRMQGTGTQEIVKVENGSENAWLEPVQLSLATYELAPSENGKVIPIIIRVEGLYQKNHMQKRIPFTDLSIQERTRILFVR